MVNGDTGPVGAVVGIIAVLCISWILSNDVVRIFKRAAPGEGIHELRAAFLGSHSLEEIQVKIWAALRIYGLNPTSENVSYAGRVLTEIRKRTGTPEIQLLDAMIVSPVLSDFAVAASLIERKIGPAATSEG